MINDVESPRSRTVTKPSLPKTRARRPRLSHGILAPFFLLTLTLCACKQSDPRQELVIVSSESYWVIDSKVGQTNYVAPAVRLVVRNRGNQAHRAIEATASFRRVGEENLSWGSAWARLTPLGKTLAPGATATIVLKSDGRYYSQGAPDGIFRHELFKDAQVDVYLRIGASSWTKMLETRVDRRIGSHSVDAIVTAAPSGLPSPPR
jgi:hypothetical protein